MSYTGGNAGRGLHWVNIESSGTAYSAIDSTKVFNALEGNTQGTIEVVAEVDAVTGNGSRIFTIGAGMETGRFSLMSYNINRVQFRWLNNGTAGNWPLDFNNVGRCVLHAVLDTTQADPNNRARLYLNGTRVMGRIGLGG